MLFWIFLMRCSSRSIVIILIVSKEIQKYDQRKFYFFSIFFSVHQNCKTKKFAISKIPNKKFRNIHYFANVKYKRNSRKYCENNLHRNIFVKRKIFAQKNSIIKIFTKKKFVAKKFRKKNCWKKKIQKQFFEKKNFLKIF